MIKFLPILGVLLYGFVIYKFSAWRLRKELDERSAELADPELRRLTQRLADALEIERVKVHLYDIEPVNGLAAPDGRIFITRGFFRKYQQGVVSGEEMASVIAHELGHVALGHSRRRMIDFSGQNALRTVLAMVLSRFLPGIGIWIANGITTLLTARLSRSDEYEADAYASALLVKSGIGTAQLQGVGPNVLDDPVFCRDRFVQAAFARCLRAHLQAFIGCPRPEILALVNLVQ